MYRRTFLQIGGAMLGYNLLPAIAQEKYNDKSVILIYLSGGASHIETFDPKPEAPVEFRSTTGYVSSNGIELGGSFKNLINHADKLNIVRSFTHNNNSHDTATHWVMTGHNLTDNGPNAAQKEPACGSIISALSQKNADGMPNYVRVNKIQHDDSAWLGVTCSPYDARGEGIDNLKLKIGNNRFLDRKSLLNRFEKDNGNWSQIQNEAYKVLTGKAAEAFDLTKENEKVAANYTGEFGKQLLLARRLIERGTKFVTINHGGWDMHGLIKAGFDIRGTDLDYNLSSLVNDLWSKGLNKNTLVIVTGEFGRTPRINATAGRDHFSRICPLLFIGGGFDGGNIIGVTTKNADDIISTPFHPMDLLYTICDYFGLDKNITKIDNSGRPRQLIDNNARNILI